MTWTLNSVNLPDLGSQCLEIYTNNQVVTIFIVFKQEKQVQLCDDGNEKTCGDLVEAKTDNSKGAEIPQNDDQMDLTSHVCYSFMLYKS